MIHRFEQSDSWQRQLRDRYLKLFYEQYCKNGQYVFVEGKPGTCCYLLQTKIGIDTIALTGSTGKPIGIEEKIDRHYGSPNFMLETDSCTVEGKEKEGWMHYSEADFLFYAFVLTGEKGLDLYVLPFHPLKKWFWGMWMKNERNHKKAHTMPDTSNHTKSMKVPIREVTSFLPSTSRFLITQNGIQRLNTTITTFELNKMLTSLYLDASINVLEIAQQDAQEGQSA